MFASGYKGVATILWQKAPFGKSHLKHFDKTGAIHCTNYFQINGWINSFHCESALTDAIIGNGKGEEV
ncbi:hypothetical protein AXI59_16280 [Bacillus nakamurai]|uniref:Uncharacterized protein n=1 Tax=Bacillus nakamurai TaxID=1793963 RepID=A0A150F2G8_9BACI|nr:hypothetical protein AXI58_06290 [Bacillus nakamurai]KXZ18814.1 hypothetical protein AXI59_16280 [Bacillus nakamurai]